MIVNKNVVEYINSLEDELPKYLKELEEEAKEENVPIIKKETQALLRFLIKFNKPKKILEIGTATGFSAVYMSEYMPEQASITTIEKVEMRLEKARTNLKTSPRSDKIALLEGDALVILDKLAKEEKQSYDFMFLDAAKGQYLNFLPGILELLSSKGMLITDNVLQDGTISGSRYAIKRRDRTIHIRMREYLYKLKHTKDLETIIIPIGDGVALTTRERTK